MEVVNTDVNILCTKGGAYYDRVTGHEDTEFLNCSSDSTLLIWS